MDTELSINGCRVTQPVVEARPRPSIFPFISNGHTMRLLPLGGRNPVVKAPGADPSKEIETQRPAIITSDNDRDRLSPLRHAMRDAFPPLERGVFSRYHISL